MALLLMVNSPDTIALKVSLESSADLARLCHCWLARDLQLGCVDNSTWGPDVCVSCRGRLRQGCGGTSGLCRCSSIVQRIFFGTNECVCCPGGDGLKCTLLGVQYIHHLYCARPAVVPARVLTLNWVKYVVLPFTALPGKHIRTLRQSQTGRSTPPSTATDGHHTNQWVPTPDQWCFKIVFCFYWPKVSFHRVSPRCYSDCVLHHSIWKQHGPALTRCSVLPQGWEDS